MSASSASTERIPLRAIAAEPNTEVVVIDANFRTIARGLYTVEIDVPPGFYRVEFRAGDTVHSEYAIVRPGGDPDPLRGPELLFSTPAPITKTKTSSETHRDPAVRLSREVRASLGTGSGLFIFVRDVDTAPGPKKNPARGVSIHDLSGRSLAVDREGEHNVEEQWAGMAIDVEPGLYRLRVRTDIVGTFEQMVVASPGWQTQIFMVQRSYWTDYKSRTQSESRRRADPFNASVMMTRLERAQNLVDGFLPGEEELRTIELARQGLAMGRQVMPHRQVDQELLWQKYRDPMFGILGGHLLLLEEPVNLEYLDTVSGNLRGLIGRHPDVEALVVALALAKGDPPEDVEPFEQPPMLRSSWQILVEASSSYPHLVPAGSLTARISDAMWGGGAWLTWRLQNIVPLADAKPLDAAAPDSVMSQVADRMADPDWLAKVEASRALNALELSLLHQLVNAARQIQPPDYLRKQVYIAKGAPERSMGDLLSEEALVRALGVPVSSIRQAAGGLSKKLNLDPESQS